MPGLSTRKPGFTTPRRGHPIIPILHYYYIKNRGGCQELFVKLRYKMFDLILLYCQTCFLVVLKFGDISGPASCPIHGGRVLF